MNRFFKCAQLSIDLADSVACCALAWDAELSLPFSTGNRSSRLSLPMLSVMQRTCAGEESSPAEPKRSRRSIECCSSQDGSR
jgi:hypothetical protein